MSRARRTASIVGVTLIGLLAPFDLSVKAESRWRPTETMHVILHGGTDDLLLLTDAYEPVRKELNLTAEQQAEFDKISADIQAFDEQLAAIGEEPAGDDFESHLRAFHSQMSKRLGDVLTTDQWERIGELSFQGKAPKIPPGLIIKRALGLTPDQLKRRSELQALAEVQVDILNHAVRNGELIENSKTVRQVRENLDRYMLDVLTAEQRACLNKMKGERR